ncbi:MAG TPA: CDP-archaeol synthase [Candidatus Saccharimonadales bacterium]|nr:CDP-archaeol synthase [Candidatus Saccharimonadales bacterium]
MLHNIALAFWFFLPPALANATPIGVAALPYVKRWDAPMDFGKSFQGWRILGPHKTWRGLIAGMLSSTIALWLQQLAYDHTGWGASIGHGVPYNTLPTLVLGPLFGLGALGGDAIKSFFKRRRGTPSGATWLPFDQLDYVVGGTVVSLPFVVLAWPVYVWILVLWFGIHFIASYLGWKAGLKQQPI